MQVVARREYDDTEQARRNTAAAEMTSTAGKG